MALSLNRYMVECKFEKINSTQKKSNGLNRYMVECKSTGYVFREVSFYGLNRYMVECKCCSASAPAVRIAFK